MKKVNVFVSSTCYDLSQVRMDMSDFISNLGHQPFLSEFDNFPVNPNEQTITNCISNVKNEADIFILIIGNRYGSVLETGKSITNLEFLTAKNKNIPIYIFIDKKVLNALTFWKSNKEGVFTNIVDNVQIFEFIQDIRENFKLWTFEFEKAQDITTTLKSQLTYLFKESLNLRSKMSQLDSSFLSLPLSNKALSIAIEKQDYFEILFLSQILIDELNKYEHLKNDYTYGIFLQSNIKHVLENHEILNWSSQRFKNLINITKSIENLFNKPLKIYYGEPGISSDLKGLYYVAKTYGKIFESLVNLTIEISSTNVPEESIKIRNIISKFLKILIDEMWNYPFIYNNLLEDWNKKSFIGVKSEDLSFNISLKLDPEISIEFKNAIDEYAEFYKSIQ